jgi:hypothetical protein
METNNSSNNINTCELEFTLVPEFLQFSNQSLNYTTTNNSTDTSMSEILLLDETIGFGLKNKFSVNLNIPELLDWVI